jgi:hypothetical protein
VGLKADFKMFRRKRVSSFLILVGSIMYIKIHLNMMLGSIWFIFGLCGQTPCWWFEGFLGSMSHVIHVVFVERAAFQIKSAGKKDGTH